ncbi:Protease 3 precursor [Pirellulimonas nuda]|uniref:Protease 3 n=1 Tax=Pirellulimonas nuda TaxID=2528009 RepID=A0A518DEM8_9BACT|nr:pitrilysin family protein [Pirellulimonas nuda]QDU89929.1 Protease 3 precursor [Pirellulimonas nuda]
MEFRKERLDNGLELVAECDPDAHSLAMGFFVRAGSRDETDDVAGVSHFLEHMLFKGTERRSADDVNREFDEIGAHYNAFTSEESTVYYASVLPEHQTSCIDLLADIMRPSLRVDDFDMEKKVIQEEIQMYLDQPPYGMDDRVKQLAFGGHAITRSVLGTDASIAALSRDQMAQYFAQRYAPSNLYVAAAGRLDFEQLVDDLNQRCGAWTGPSVQRQIEKLSGRTGFEAVTQPSATQQYVLRLGAAPDAEDADRFAAKLLTTIVGDDSGSRFYWEFIDPGIAESASLGHYEYQGLGMYYAWLSAMPEDAEEILERIEKVLQQVDAQGVTADELKLAKAKLRSRVVLGSERPRSRMFSVGGNWGHRREYRAVRDDLRSIDALTPDDIARVLGRFPLAKSATLTVGPRDDIATPRV